MSSETTVKIYWGGQCSLPSCKHFWMLNTSTTECRNNDPVQKLFMRRQKYQVSVSSGVLRGPGPLLQDGAIFIHDHADLGQDPI